MTDDNTYYLVNGNRHKTSEVMKNSSILNYDIPANETNKNASELLQEALLEVNGGSVGSASCAGASTDYFDF